MNARLQILERVCLYIYTLRARSFFQPAKTTWRKCQESAKFFEDAFSEKRSPNLKGSESVLKSVIIEGG